MIDQPYLLTDGQIHDFIVNGFITIKTDLPIGFHEEVYNQITRIFEREGNPGNNLLPRIPVLNQVFNDPKVIGALTGLLGSSYYMQPHRHCHYNPPGSKGQNMHQDGGKRWSHKSRRLLVFYYPQDTPEELGPTGIVPGSHYYNTSLGADVNSELPLCGQAGEVTFANYDLWHRAMPNHTSRMRYMMKFLYLRMCETEKATWLHKESDWKRVSAKSNSQFYNPDHEQMYQSIWKWHLGEYDQSVERVYCRDSVESLIADFETETEAECLTNAYALSRFGAPVSPDLANLLANESGHGQRYAFYGLTTLGEPAVPQLIDYVEHTNESVRSSAIETLGDIGPPASESVVSIRQQLQDPSAQVRSKVVESLGTIVTESNHELTETIRDLTGALSDENDRVRQNATIALCRIAPHCDQPIMALQRALVDGNRYVRGDAVHALRRINTPSAKEALIDHLVTARWCSLTSSESTH